MTIEENLGNRKMKFLEVDGTIAFYAQAQRERSRLIDLLAGTKTAAGCRSELQAERSN
jgi:hypothetical protein